ncbi:MAG: hypothetical protein ACKJSG_11285 [Lentisphaeria bacterium]
MNYHRSKIGAVLIVVLAMIAGGCGKKPVQKVQDHMFGDITLDQAYEKLLNNPQWLKVKIDKVNYVQVSGTLKANGKAFDVNYVYKQTPPVAAYAQYAGKRYEADALAELVADMLIMYELEW